jgi:hypothetical protein
MTAPAVLVISCTLDELRAIFREEARSMLAQHSPAPASVRLTIDELAHAERTSRATVRRLMREGAPVHFVGASPRFDLAEWRAWLAERGRRGTTAGATDAGASLAGVVRTSPRGTR